jgi:hypothetical protein
MPPSAATATTAAMALPGSSTGGVHGTAPRGSSSAEDTTAEGAVTGEAAVAAAADTAWTAFAAGTVVQLKGLVERPDLNGQTGVVVAFNDTRGRLTVIVQPLGGPIISVLPVKLAKVPGASKVSVL